jgi:hypothetical protein
MVLLRGFDSLQHACTALESIAEAQRDHGIVLVGSDLFADLGLCRYEAALDGGVEAGVVALDVPEGADDGIHV